MNDILVIGNRLEFRGKTYPCATGKGGFSENKREGDGATPIGTFTLRECWFRPDRWPAPPQTALPLKPIAPGDGWCDDPAHPDYNRPIKKPFAASHEDLWRDEAVYDLIIPMSYNDAPPVPGLGSAIFMHIAKPGYLPTEGCVALSLEDWREILPHLAPNTTITVKKPT